MFHKDFFGLFSTPSKQITVALVGLGYWGKNHQRVLERKQDIGCVLLLDPLIDCALVTRNRGQKCENGSGLSHCISKADLAVIATPVGSHTTIAQQFLLAGIPTLVEKPLAPTLEQCKLLFEIARKKETFLATGFQYCFHPAFQEMKYLIKTKCADQVVTPVNYHSERSGGIPRPDADVILDLAIHDIAIATWFFGKEPTGITINMADASADGKLSACNFHLHFCANQHATIHADWHGVPSRRFTLDLTTEVLFLDEIQAPSELVYRNCTSGHEVVRDIEQGTSLDRQADWLISEARQNTFNTELAEMNLMIMRTATRVKAFAWDFLSLSSGTGSR